jgi:hypothetical protein
MESVSCHVGSMADNVCLIIRDDDEGVTFSTDLSSEEARRLGAALLRASQYSNILPRFSSTLELLKSFAE